MPIGIATSRPINSASTVSSSVAGTRSRRASLTDCPVRTDVPRSPRTVSLAQFAQRTNNGSSSPSSSLIRATCSGVALSPRMAYAGSPGAQVDHQHRGQADQEQHGHDVGELAQR